MKKTYLFFCIIQLLSLGNLQSQNFVPNPSFENYTTCPTSMAQINLATPWITPTSGSPDYFNTCGTSSFCVVPTNFFGNQVPRTGNAYAQLVTYPSAFPLREYVQTQLLSPLVAGQTYNVSFYISLQDKSYRVSNNIGIYISVSAPSSAGSGPLPLIPQINETNVINDIVNWTLISGTYTAIGGEEYITIGNFYDDISTTTAINPSGNGAYATFYLIEDVCVTPQGGMGCNTPLPVELLDFYGEGKEYYNQLHWITASEINNDYFTIEKSNDASNFYEIGIVLGAGNSNKMIKYQLADENLIESTNYYRLKQTDYNGDHSYSKIIAIKNKTENISVYPNPFNNKVNINIKDYDTENVTIEIYSVAGEMVMLKNFVGSENISINLNKLSLGTYHLKIYNDKFTHYKKIVKTN